MRKLLFVWVLFLSSAPFLHAQQDMFKSLFIYNFTKNIEWPVDYQKGDFVISVVGQDAITAELQKLADTKKVNLQPIRVNQLTNISEVPQAHIIYVSSSKSGSLASVIDYYKNKPTLIVTHQGGGCRDGAGINFILVDGKIKFEICPRHITNSKLNLSPKLTNLGILVE